MESTISGYDLESMDSNRVIFWLGVQVPFHHLIKIKKGLDRIHYSVVMRLLITGVINIIPQTRFPTTP